MCILPACFGALINGDEYTDMMKLRATITCPSCNATASAEMPTDACQYFWDGPACQMLLKPKPGDCCALCSWSDTPVRRYRRAAPATERDARGAGPPPGTVLSRNCPGV